MRRWRSPGGRARLRESAPPTALRRVLGAPAPRPRLLHRHPRAGPQGRGWQGERSRPCRELRRLGLAARPPGAGRSKSLGTSRVARGEPARCFAAPAVRHSQRCAAARGKLLAHPLPAPAALLWPAGRKTRAESGRPFPFLPLSSVHACGPPRGRERGCWGDARAASRGSPPPGCGQRPPDPHVRLGSGSRHGKRESRAGDKRVNAGRGSYL